MNSTSKPFAWSPARSKTYSSCPLKYYLSYVLAPSGWQRDATEDARTAYKVGHVTTLALEIGNQVHLAVRGVLTRRINGGHVSQDYESDLACSRLGEWLEQSAKMSWEDLGFGRRQLDRHFDGKALEAGELEDAMLEVRACISGFFSSPVARHAMNRPDLLIPQMLDPVDFRIVEVDGVPLMSRTDAVLREPGGGGLHILDWKTGRAHPSHAESGAVQELYVRAGYEVPPAWRVKTSHVYLQDVHTETSEPTEEQKSDMLLLARDEIMLMREDHEQLEEGRDPLTVLPPRPREGRCDYCSFRRLCPYSKAKGP